MEWNEEAIAQLRALWQDGHSTAEIGRRMGVTKNAVVGKAHRLDLPSRPSPIRREALRRDGPRPAPAERRAVARRPIAPAPAPRPAEGPRVFRPVSVATVPSFGGRVSPCCWPIGEPGTRTFRFCDEATVPNKPYCAAHAQLAYVKVKDRRDAAA